MAKFTYTDRSDSGEPVAYIDNDGDLRIRADDESAVMIATDPEIDVHPAQSGIGWYPHSPDVIRRFYRGDSVTITF